MDALPLTLMEERLASNLSILFSSFRRKFNSQLIFSYLYSYYIHMVYSLHFLSKCSPSFFLHIMNISIFNFFFLFQNTYVKTHKHVCATVVHFSVVTHGHRGTSLLMQDSSINF